ncbi:MAG: DUF2125 domain-containing protein [Pseudomonadota bacterium]
MFDDLRDRLGLIIPFGLFGVFAIVYTVIWLNAANLVRTEIALAVERETTEGRTLNIGATKVRGYPFNLRGTLSDVVYARPGLGQFEAEEVIFATLPLSPDRIILSPRGEQFVTLGKDRYALKSDDLRLSLARGDTALETHGVSMTSELRVMTITTLIGNVQELERGSAIALGVRGFALDGEVPIDIANLDFAASAHEDTLTIANLGFSVGENDGDPPSQVAGKGELLFDDKGRANGKLDVTVKNQDPLIGVLTNSGSLGAGEAAGARLVLGLMSDNGNEAVELPFTFSGGRMELGPLSIGSMPPLPR